MRRLVFIVEGATEIILVQNLIEPYLIKLGFTNPINAQTIVTNRKLHKKGGVGSYGKFKNEVNRTLAQGNVIVTTMIDFYKLPSDFPSFSLNSNQIEVIEKAIHQDFDFADNFTPYIQLHELEALMFSDRSGFELVIDDEHKLKQVDAIITQFPNPEDINNDPETAPSKRLKKIFNYDKTGDGELIFEMIGMESMKKKCPRFSVWIDNIIEKLELFR